MADIQRGRTGWKKEEDTLLFAEIEKLGVKNGWLLYPDPA